MITCDQCESHSVQKLNETETLEQCFFWTAPILMPGTCGACINFREKRAEGVIDISESKQTTDINRTN